MDDSKFSSPASSQDKQTTYPCFLPQQSPETIPPINADLNRYVPYKRKEQDEILGHTSSRRSLIVVLLCWGWGILFSELFINGGYGVFVPVLLCLFYMVVFWYFSKKEPKPPKSAHLLLLPIALLSLGCFLHENPSTWFINTLMLLALIPLQLSFMSGTATGTVFSPQSVYQTFISTVTRPFGFLDVPFKTISGNIRHGKKATGTMMIFWGLLISLPIAGIFIALFSQADSAFGYYARQFFSNFSFHIGNTVFDVFFGTLTAIFLSALLITMRARKTPKEKEFQVAVSLNGLLTATVLFILNLVQIAFVLIQCGYLFAGMKLPDNLSYAEYARSGFFQLCGVLCISVIIIMLCLFFVKKDDSRRLPKAVSVLLTLFIACNYVVVVSAVYRMFAYIAAYDLSVKRVMVTWLILVFALCMIGAVLKIWMPKFHVFQYTAITVVAMSVALNFINVNALVSNYNVDSYLQSRETQTVRSIDVSYLGTLGPAAVKATAKLYANSDSDVHTETKQLLTRQKNDLAYKSWKCFCLSDIEAKQALASVNWQS